MNLVVDANIVIAALIKDGITAELIFEPRLRLFAPEFLFEEICDHEEELLRKTARPKEDYDTIMLSLMEAITIVPREEFGHFLGEGGDVSPDPDDFVYFALALRLKAAIWSNDKRLKGQERVAVYSTTDLGRCLGIADR